jgi:hypothetical protein
VSVKFHKATEPAATTTETARALVPPPPGPTVDQMEDAPHTKEETLEVEPAPQ